MAARALGGGLALLVLFLLFPFVSGLLGAAVLYVLTKPLLRGVRSPRRRRVAAFALMFACFFALLLPAAWLLAELLAQVPEAARQLHSSGAVQRVMALRLGDIALGSVLRQVTSEVVAWSSRETIDALGGAVHATLNLVVALFGTYYLLTMPGLWQRIRGRLPLAAPLAEVLKRRFLRVTEAMVLGVVVASVAQGLLVGAAFRGLGLPHSLLWGAVTAVLSVLPIFGSAIVWLPAAAVLFAHDRIGAAAFLLGYGGLVVSNIDNVLRLVVYKRVSQIHPMVTLVGAFGGVLLFGLAGLLLGPLLLSYALEVAALASAPAGEALA